MKLVLHSFQHLKSPAFMHLLETSFSHSHPHLTHMPSICPPHPHSPTYHPSVLFLLPMYPTPNPFVFLTPTTPLTHSNHLPFSHSTHTTHISSSLSPLQSIFPLLYSLHPYLSGICPSFTSHLPIPNPFALVLTFPPHLLYISSIFPLFHPQTALHINHSLKRVQYFSRKDWRGITLLKAIIQS